MDGSLRTHLPLLDRKTQFLSITHYSGTMELTQEKKQQESRSVKLTYVSNIYVVKDPANPENEGKVFLYKYGKKNL